jgi:hypothetical protein
MGCRNWQVVVYDDCGAEVYRSAPKERGVAKRSCDSQQRMHPELAVRMEMLGWERVSSRSKKTAKKEVKFSVFGGRDHWDPCSTVPTYGECELGTVDDEGVSDFGPCSRFGHRPEVFDPMFTFSGTYDPEVRCSVCGTRLDQDWEISGVQKTNAQIKWTLGHLKELS